MLSFVPDSLLLYIVNAILIIGAVGSFLTFFVLHRVLRWFPALSPYYLVLQVVSAGLLVAGIYFKGGYDTEASWREKLQVAEEKARIAEEQAKQVNEKVVTVYKDRVKVVTDTKVVIQEKLKEVEKIIDGKCEVAPEAIDIHNAAAKNRKPVENK